MPWSTPFDEPIALPRAFSSEMDTGSRQENASNQESRAPFRFHRNGKGSSGRALATLQHAADHIMKLPEAEQHEARWQTAVEHLIHAAETGGGWLMFARIAMMRALYRIKSRLAREKRARERFPAKACPALDAGWTPVRVKKTRQIKNLEPRSDSIGTEKALVPAATVAVPAAKIQSTQFEPSPVPDARFLNIRSISRITTSTPANTRHGYCRL